MRLFFPSALLLASSLAFAGGQSPPQRVGSVPLVPALNATVLKEIDRIVAGALASTRDPGVSIAIAKEGKIVFAKAYGNARLDPAVPATPSMRYKIGSISKQFVAASMLLLEQDGKLNLNDKVAKYFPELSGAGAISLRQLLNHTAGYPDFYPLDIVTIEMSQPITADTLMTRYGKQALDFTPGRRWAYSNTNYVIAGRVIEQVSGMPLGQFITERIAKRLGMSSLVDTAAVPWSDADALGYTRYGLATPRVAPSEGRGWTFAAGQLAMTASDLARWDLALLNNALLTPASRAALTASVSTAEGGDAHYALGLGVETTPEGRLRWSHGGGVGGYMTRNVVYPEQGIAIVVLTNTSGFRLSGVLEAALEALLLPPGPVASASAPTAPAAPAALPATPARDVEAGRAKARARAAFAQLQQGKPDRSRMTADLSAFLNARAVNDHASSLAPLGPLVSIEQLFSEPKGRFTSRVYRIQTKGTELMLFSYFAHDGKLAQFTLYEKPRQ